jgi:hypothetical protein
MGWKGNILVNDDDDDDDDSNSHSHQPNLGVVFDRHIKHEFEDDDVDATMQTMTKEPYVHHVPIMTGGVGIKRSTIFIRITL